MGYVLNELSNLPIDDKIQLYFFVVNGQFREPLYEMMEQNFLEIARSIGNNAVIAVGTNREAFTTSVARHYLGKGMSDRTFLNALPALLVTNAHPEQLREESMRLLVPLRDAESRFGGWQQFFTLLGQFARRENDEFLRRFEQKTDFLDAANKIAHLKPNLFGMGVNLNEVIDLWNKGRKGRA